MRIQLEGPARALVSTTAGYFAEHGVEAWATGGFLRDAFLGREPHDIDVTIAGDPLAFGPDLAKVLNAHFVVLDAERRHVRLVLKEDALYLDLTPLRAPGIESDLRLRDYTVDALAAPLAAVASSDFTILDPTDGVADLDAELVRVISEQALLDDPLRLLRGPRIATQLGFEIEPGTADLIRRHVALATTPAAERQREELMRICGTGAAGRGLRLLDELGLLTRLLPEIEEARGCEQPKEHHYDVLGHLFAAVGCLDFLLADDEPPNAVAAQLWHELWGELEWCEGLREYFREEVAPGTERRALLKFCGFLHDIAKPQTKSFEENGRMRFFGHGEQGAEIAGAVMRRLRFSSRETAVVRKMIEAHLRPIQLGQTGKPSARAIYKFFRDTGEAGIDTLFLSLADHLATVGPRVSIEGFQRHVALTSYILEERFGDQTVVSPPRLIDGDELMAELGLSPGPLVGRLLETLREAQAAGEVTDREGALSLARDRLETERQAVESGLA